MAKLCPTCQKKKPDVSVRGSCQAPSYAPRNSIPQNHNPWTESPNFSLCDACAEQYKLCAWCWGPLDGGGGVLVPTDKQFTFVFEHQNGMHVEGMDVGEQILAELRIDVFSGITWKVKRLSRGVRFAFERVERDGGQFAAQQMYFDLDQADPKAVIELEQTIRSYWWWTPTLTNPKTWSITVEVRR